MSSQEFKTTVISYDARENQTQAKPMDFQSDVGKPTIQQVMFNITTKVPHVSETLPTLKVENIQPTKKIDLRSVEAINPQAKAIPKFYMREYKRSGRIAIMWGIITAVCLALEIWALVAIIQNIGVNNWTALTLIPPISLCIGFLVVYINNWINFRNEARNVDFTQGKIPTLSVMKLYKRLKTAHININWFCGLTYLLGGLTILCSYITGWWLTGKGQWGNLDPALFESGPALLITVILSIIAIIVSFIVHIVLLVTNYTRAAKIDNFYSVQIVSDDELTALKKKKNRRDMIIFLAIVGTLVLIGLLIYRLVKSRKVNNTVTINNGPSVTAG